MVKALIDGIFSVLMSVASIFTSPISNVINNAVPQVGDMVTAITNLINMLLSVIPYFIHLLPPLTRSACYIVITFWVAQQPLQYAIQGVTNILNLIKRINIFTSR